MIRNFLIGIVIGIANVLPGVSGGTLAVVLGIYDNLTEAVGNFLTASMEKKIEYAKFLSQIGAGAALGIVAFAGVISKSCCGSNGYPWNFRIVTSYIVRWVL